jgi:hypothetical protein
MRWRGWLFVFMVLRCLRFGEAFTKHQLTEPHRWNSTRDMLVRAIRLRESITHFLDLEELYYTKLVEKDEKTALNERPEDSVTRIVFQNRMGADDWALAAELVDILEPIKECTKLLEGRPDEHSEDGIAQVYPILKILLANMEKLKPQFSEHIALAEAGDPAVQRGAPYWMAIEHGWNKTREYYNLINNSPVYTAAVFLDPRLSFDYLKKEWGIKDATACVRKVRALWEKEYRHRTPPVINTNECFLSQGSSATLQEVDGNARKRFKPNPKFRTVKEGPAETYSFPPPEKVMDEFTAYRNSPRETDSTIIPPQYWRRPDVCARFPTLSLMAMDILAIPAMSAEPERIFSLAGNVFSARRNRLHETTVEAQLCLANWGNNKLIKLGHHHGKVPRGSLEAEMSHQVSGDTDDDDDDDDDVDYGKDGELFQEDWRTRRFQLRRRCSYRTNTSLSVYLLAYYSERSPSPH